MSEPEKIDRNTILEALGIKNVIVDIGPAWNDQEIDEALKAVKEFLPEGYDWYRCKPCPFCGQTAVIPLPIDGVEKYKAGSHPQYAFPGESAEKREMVHTGIHPECWNELLPVEEE